MKTIYASTKTKPRIRLAPVVILTLFAIAGGLNPANAQRYNLSDWNVPPPIPPGTIPKGGVSVGKGSTTKAITLTLNDIPAVALPYTPPVAMPDLAAISTAPPLVSVPAQPTILGIQAQLPDIPAPGTPEAPDMPQQSSQDVQVSPGTNELPIPTAPEMPAFPTRPVPSGQVTLIKGPLPVMPGLINMSVPLIPSANAIMLWPTPGIPENARFKFITQPAAKTDQGRGKDSKKAKSPKN